MTNYSLPGCTYAIKKRRLLERIFNPCEEFMMLDLKIGILSLLESH
jgi:hypothetical protein